ncbi:hypothetical protein [Azospirillum picis]|uniref:Uncharacterized protein n=1 Tax=Azospirillum picis TaxID=488438 RepID=A0ABU0MV44_9PROT|nr:hypothetical protein [Azospirillum picis]MBP2303490.1 hypothetical protein [Azospirillum picis]MDQ0537369.1 hypothetical protein [Azospirillum picis]
MPDKLHPSRSEPPTIDALSAAWVMKVRLPEWGAQPVNPSVL